MNSTSNSNLLPITSVDSGQYTPVQSRNLDIVPYSTGQIARPSSSMEIESIFGNMLKQVSMTGQMSKENFFEARTKIEALEDRSNLIGEALDTLVSKDQEITNMMRNQSSFNDSVSQAMNWLKSSIDTLHQASSHDPRKLQDLDTKVSEEIKSLQLSCRDQSSELRNLTVGLGLTEDHLKNLVSSVNAQTSSNNNALTQVNSMTSKLRDVEGFLQKLESRVNKVEDRVHMNEVRVKDTQKTLEELPSLKETLNSHTRDLLGIDEENEKLKKAMRTLENKIGKYSPKKLTKNEKSVLSSIETDVTIIQEKVQAMETLLNHLNEVKYEDFGKQFKKEIIDDSSNQISKLSKEINNLSSKADMQNKLNDNIQRNLKDLKTKLDIEYAKLQDLSILKNNEEKWKTNETKLEAANNALEEIFKKIKQHDVEILHLSDNVFDYSYKEMADNFDQRVDNRLTKFKQQLQEMSQNITNLSKEQREDNGFDKFIEKVQKMVNNKLECYTDSIDQKLINIANLKDSKAPAETMSGKKILYKTKDRFVDPDQVQVLVDGSYHLIQEKKEDCPENPQHTLPHSNKYPKEQSNHERSKNTKERNKNKLSNYQTQRKKTPMPPHIHNSKIECKNGLRCISRTCKYYHNEDLEPETQKRTIKTEHRFITRADDCEFKEFCTDPDCHFRHRQGPCRKFWNCENFKCQKRHHPDRINFYYSKMHAQNQQFIQTAQPLQQSVPILSNGLQQPITFQYPYSFTPHQQGIGYSSMLPSSYTPYSTQWRNFNNFSC